jgi:hypothetical protein
MNFSSTPPSVGKWHAARPYLHCKQPEDMAATWEELASVGKHQIDKKDKSNLEKEETAL